MKRTFSTIFAASIGTLLLVGSCSSGEQPEDIELVWHEESGYRWADLPVDTGLEPGFEKLPSTWTGVTVNNALSNELMDQNRVLMNGSGVAAGDINGDGKIDLYFPRLDGPNVLYLNRGAFQFEDVTEQAGVAHEGHYSTGALFADVNGNGHLDLLVTTLDSRNALYLNDGTGNFTLKEDSGLEQAKGSMTMAMADISGNGYPDLYLVNYREINVIDVFPAQDLLWENTIENGELIPPYDDYFTIIDRGDDHPPERHEIGRADELYLNNGDGTFAKVADPENRFLDQNGDPLGLYPDWGLAAKFQDLNGNGLQDLYVSNDFWTPDRIWMNQGDGTFRAADSLAFRNSSYYSMTVDFSDINRNGYTDIFTVEMLNDNHSERLQKRLPVEPIPLRPGEYHHRPRYNRNSLFLNRGDNTYSEISYYSGLEASEWSWSTRFLDLDLDGFEDLIIANGFAYDFQDLDSQQQLFERLVETQGLARGYVDTFIPLRQQNRIFRNNGDLRFSNVSSDWGFQDLDISLGLALADLNGDGLQDLVVSRLNDEPAIYKNRAAGNRIAVRLAGENPNTQAVGATVTVRGGAVPEQTKQVISGGDYLSGSDPLMVFAAGDGEPDLEIEIRWPDGKLTRLLDLSANRIYEIDQSIAAQSVAAEGRADVSNGSPPDSGDRSGSPYFISRTDQINHVHHEDAYDDFRIQPLLPRTLSRMGPGMALLDLNGNGQDELVIGSGKGGFTDIFERQNDGSWSQSPIRLSETPSPGDQTGIVGWIEEDRTHLVIGLANYEIGSSSAPSALHYQFEEGRVVSVDSLPGILSTTGPLAAADYNGDGRVDLFIGGRFIPGQYPRDAASRLFLNDNGTLVPDRENNSLLQNAGLVSSAIFVDYNRDGQQDLILATEWGRVRVFENQDGQFTERTAELGLENYQGMWQGIASGDFTGNGYPDLVVTNWGENSIYQIENPDHPLRLFYGDFNRNQRMDIIDSYYEPQVGDYVPRRNLADYEQIQDILWHVESNRQFSEMSVSEMLRTDASQIPYKEVNRVQHMLFLNDGGERFTARPLPAESQFSAGFYAGVADMDNNGTEDLYLTQNFFGIAHPQRTPRLDGGRSLWLLGNGEGSFEPLEGHLSGVSLYGEQRGAVLGDLNADGRVDLAVSQNSAETHLFENRSERYGVRIRLEGPPHNRTGIGSSMRIHYRNRTVGPLRTVQAGSGYWSQNSSVQVLGLDGEPVSVEITWFDGRHQQIEFAEGERELVIPYQESE